MKEMEGKHHMNTPNYLKIGHKNNTFVSASMLLDKQYSNEIKDRHFKTKYKDWNVKTFFCR